MKLSCASSGLGAWPAVLALLPLQLCAAAASSLPAFTLGCIILAALCLAVVQRLCLCWLPSGVHVLNGPLLVQLSYFKPEVLV